VHRMPKKAAWCHLTKKLPHIPTPNTQADNAVHFSPQ